MSCLPLAGCGAAEPIETRRPPSVAPRTERPVEAWRQALGPLDDVEPELRAAFTDPRDFAPMPPRRRGDWRSVRPEPAQSVAEFLASAPNVREAPRERLTLLPLGRFPVDVIVGTEFVGLVRTPMPADIAALLAAFFATPTDLLPAEPLPEGLPWREVRGHRQHDAHALLGAAAPRLPADAYGMLTLVTVDLFAAPEQQYAFGWSTFHDRLAVIGFARFDPSFFGGPAPADVQGAVLRRSLRVAVHEVGHLFGLAHCQAFRCVMNGVADLDELDSIPLRLCPLCLRKLHLVTGLDVNARDAALLRAFEALGLPEEAHWLAERARRLRYVARAK
jgi:archaemetzincin